MSRETPSQVDTVIVGSGPSALILSYILHGNVPVYDNSSPHPDPILHAKLKDHVDLLSSNVDHLTEHFYGSRFSYSTQALPVNVLLDTLVRPYGETDEAKKKTCIKWIKDPARAIPHQVIGQAEETGGQWADNPVKASWDIGALSYAGMLSLPGYSFDDYFFNAHGKQPPFYLRPTRRDVARYLAEYPQKAGISDAIVSNQSVSGIRRQGHGFFLASHALECHHLVLASGTFTKLIPARPLLQPLLTLSSTCPPNEPILIVGSGFSAADVILSTPREQPIIHIFKWAPNSNPSPLRACHADSYPEYAGVYRKMKSAAAASRGRPTTRRPSAHRAPSELELSRDWDTAYEGLPNTAIVHVEMHESHATVTFQTAENPPFQRRIGAFAYVVGRRGSLEYLDRDLLQEFGPDIQQWASVNGSTLRERASEDLEVAPNCFVTGSLTGDSLIRFAYGGCAYAAGRIMASNMSTTNAENCVNTLQTQPRNGTYHTSPMKGLQGHDVEFFSENRPSSLLDRRKSEICCEGAG